MLHLDFFYNFNPYISILTRIYFDCQSIWKCCFSFLGEAVEELKQNPQQHKDGACLLFCAALKSISGIQEQQSQRGCSVTYFSRVWYLLFVDLRSSQHWCWLWWCPWWQRATALNQSFNLHLSWTCLHHLQTNPSGRRATWGRPPAGRLLTVEQK